MMNVISFVIRYQHDTRYLVISVAVECYMKPFEQAGIFLHWFSSCFVKLNMIYYSQEGCIEGWGGVSLLGLGWIWKFHKKRILN